MDDVRGRSEGRERGGGEGEKGERERGEGERGKGEGKEREGRGGVCRVREQGRNFT